MATSKTFRIEFERGALRIVQRKKIIGKACRGASGDFRKDLGVRPGEYVLTDNLQRWNELQQIEIKLVPHRRGLHLRSYLKRAHDRLVPIIQMTVRVAAALNVVDGTYRLRRLDRRGYDRHRPRA